MNRIGLGIIGLGYVGKIHLKNSLKLSNVDCIEVADLSKRALKNAKSMGVKKTFTDYKQLLKDPQIDAVVISLPTHLHTSCALKAAEAGKHIFIEKPLALTVKEAKEIVKAADRHSVKLMVGYPLRFNRRFRELKRKMANGTLGAIEVAHAAYVSSGPFFHRSVTHAPVPVPTWWFDRKLTGGGCLMDLGSHVINLLRWYFGEITDIKSHLGYRFNLGLEDKAICLTKFESGTTAVMTLGWFLKGYHLKVDFFGTVDVESAHNLLGNRLVTAINILTTGMSEFHRPHFDELNYFVNCLINDLSPSPSGEDGLKDLEAIHQAYHNSIRLD